MTKHRAPLASPAVKLTGVSTDSILESISDGVFTVDGNWRITSFNRAAEEVTGVSRGDAIGRRCADVFRASMCESECALRHTIETGAPLVNKAAFIIDAEGKRIPISVSTALLRDETGKVVGGFHLTLPRSEKMSAPEQEIRSLARDLGQQVVGDIYTGHCTGTEAFQIMKTELGPRLNNLHTGIQFEI